MDFHIMILLSFKAYVDNHLSNDERKYLDLLLREYVKGNPDCKSKELMANEFHLMKMEEIDRINKEKNENKTA